MAERERSSTDVPASGDQYAVRYRDGCAFSIFAQASLSDTVRLNIGASAVESGSVQKYPRRSNWYRVPGAVRRKLGSTRQSVIRSNEVGLR